MRVIASAIFALTTLKAFTVNAAPYYEHGDSQAYWKKSSVIIAEVVRVDPAELGIIAPDYVLRPLGTISGKLDTSRFTELKASFALPEDGVGDAHSIAKGQLVLVVLTENRGLEKNGIPAFTMEVTATLFMKPCEEVVEVLSGLTDRRVGQTLEAIQAVRKRDSASKGAPSAADAENARESRAEKYWRTHSVAFGVVKGVTPPGKGETISSLKIRPVISLAGAFDPGKTPEVALKADFAKLGAIKPPVAGGSAVFVLERDGDSYRIAEDRPKYMPDSNGHRAPICFVKNLGDPAVKKIIDQLKATRKAEGQAFKDLEPSIQKNDQGGNKGIQKNDQGGNKGIKGTGAYIDEYGALW